MWSPAFRHEENSENYWTIDFRHEDFGGPVTCLEWAPYNAQILVAGSQDGTIALLQRCSEWTVIKLEAHRDGVFALSWFPNDKAFLSVGGDSIMSIWRMQGSEIEREDLNSAGGQINYAVCVNDSIITCGRNGALNVWREGVEQETILQIDCPLWTATWNGVILGVTGSNNTVYFLKQDLLGQWEQVKSLDSLN